MTIVADDTLLGLWCVYFNGGNVMIGLNTKEPGSYTMTARLREYSTPRSGPWDGADEKHWRRRTLTAPDDAAVLAFVQEWVAKLRAAYKTNDWDEVLRGEQSLEEFVARIAQLQAANQRTLTDEQYLAEYGPDEPRPKP